MRKPERMDLLVIGLLLLVSSIFSYFKGYIDTGIGLIMVISGSYLVASGIFEEPQKKQPVKDKGLPNKKYNHNR
ncbi:hypothetical protein ACUL41_06215 [Virgibacillus natechei]|uniref:hypothetical protein n=1 Tax=Virgibacillus sp. CBA3643 TaxID=2942278 RepID=UPI0035A32181